MATHRGRNDNFLTRLVKGEVKQETLDGWMNALTVKMQALEEAEHRWDTLKQKIKEAKDSGLSVREIAKEVGVSHATVWNWLKSMEVSNGKETNDLPTQ